MNQYINAIKLLTYLDNLGIKWEKIYTTPDNLKNNLLSKYQLTKPYVDGVFDAKYKRGQYDKAIDFLKTIKTDWNVLGIEFKKDLLIETGLDLVYVNGIADEIRQNIAFKNNQSERLR